MSAPAVFQTEGADIPVEYRAHQVCLKPTTRMTGVDETLQLAKWGPVGPRGRNATRITVPDIPLTGGCKFFEKTAIARRMTYLSVDSTLELYAWWNPL